MTNTANNQTAMRLHEARICVGCETVYSRTVLTRCPACASEAFVTLLQLQEAAAINHQEPQVPKPMAPKFADAWDEETEGQYCLDRWFLGLYKGR